jgi:hypothetical protein
LGLHGIAGTGEFVILRAEAGGIPVGIPAVPIGKDIPNNIMK